MLCSMTGSIRTVHVTGRSCLCRRHPLLVRYRSHAVLRPGNGPAQVSTLNRGLLSDPESLDFHKARSTQAAEVQRDIGEGLMRYSATGELVGGVAESWTDLRRRPQLYTFTLRRRVHAGQMAMPLRPNTSYLHCVGWSTRPPQRSMRRPVAAISNAGEIIAGNLAPEELGVHASDVRTLVLSLDEPTPYLLNLLTHPSTFPVTSGPGRRAR